MTLGELSKRIYGAVSAMTSRTDITKEYLNGIQKLFTKVEDDIRVLCVPDEVIISTLDKAPSRYSGKTKFPFMHFWEELKSYEHRSWNNKQGIRTHEYIKPTTEEREKNRIKAHEITEHFKSIAPANTWDNTEGKEMVVKRRKRMIEHLKKGEVLITRLTHVSHGKWVLKTSADARNMLDGDDYYNPTHYLREAKDMGRYGTVKKND